MTETETAYKLEYEEWQRKPDAEPLPECETGSVEQMLNRAVWWGKQIEELSRSKEMGLPLAPKWQAMNVSSLLASYGVLMSNILEKMQTAEQPTSDGERAGIFIVRSDKGCVKCPACDELVSVEVVFRY